MEDRKKKELINQINDLKKMEGDRLKIEPSNNRTRIDFHRDYARLIYSSSFRRLQGKMQLLGINSSRYYRNRLTHSIEVSQIARGLAFKLSSDYKFKLWNTNDLYILDTISLAHDIGNPPFGHSGEKILNNIATSFGGFEGNAQTFRIVTHLERKFPNMKGLNLTKRTTLGLVKYFQKRNFINNKFLYDDDYELVDKIKKEYDISVNQTLDSQVMDISDEIAYSAHDLEDALHQRIINPYDLIYMFKQEKVKTKILKEFKTEDIQLAIDKFSEIVDESLEYAYLSESPDSDDIFESVFRKELCSKIVNTLINDIDYSLEKGRLEYNNYEALAVGLKKLLFKAIKNDSDKILLYEKRGGIILNGIYDALTDKNYNPDNILLSSTYRDDNEILSSNRSVIDFISGMMDTYAIEFYEKIYGKGIEDITFKKDNKEISNYSKTKIKNLRRKKFRL